MNKRLLQSILIVLVFIIAVYGNRVLRQFVEISLGSPICKIIYSYMWWIVPIVVATGLLFGFRNILKELCLDKNILFGLTFSLIAVSPMLLSSFFLGKIDDNIAWLSLLKKTLFAGFMEETLFRGFLFGILFRRLGWGFIPAAMLGAIVFGLGHLYQGSSTNELIGIFTITFIGSAWFAWLFIEWGENLWIPIFLHGLMNMSWILFNMSNNAIGGTYSNIFRIFTIALTVVATILYNIKRDEFRINRKNLLTNKLQ